MRYGKRHIEWALQAAAIIAVAFLSLPFVWMLLTSFKTPQELAVYPPTWWPTRFHLGNFEEVLKAIPLGRFYLNSAVTGLLSTAVTLLISLTMAYAFLFLRFPGRTMLLGVIIATMLLPEEVKLIPNYLLTARLGWIDTYWGLAIPPAANAFPLFVLYQHMRTVPSSLLDAARIDGAGHARILWSVITPMARPMLAAVALVTFLGRWNDYLWPLVMTNTPAMRTLPLGLAYFRQAGEGSAPWHLLMAATALAIIPLLVLYALAQRQFVSGLTQGALKG